MACAVAWLSGTRPPPLQPASTRRHRPSSAAVKLAVKLAPLPFPAQASTATTSRSRSCHDMPVSSSQFACGAVANNSLLSSCAALLLVRGQAARLQTAEAMHCSQQRPSSKLADLRACAAPHSSQRTSLSR